MIGAIVDELAPNLVARHSIGRAGAAQLLLTAGDNAEPLRSEAAFAALCGVSPVPARSGKTTPIASTAVATVRPPARRTSSPSAGTNARTKAYVAKRIAEGHSKLEAIRCLKRYIAREVFTRIMQRQREINQTRIAA